MLGSGRGLKGYADVDERHTTIMAIMAVCGGGLLARLLACSLACLRNYRRSQPDELLSTRQFRVTESMDPWN